MRGSFADRMRASRHDGSRGGLRRDRQRVSGHLRRKLTYAAHRLRRARRTGATRPKQTGFAFHTIDGERYWDERAYYAFTLEEIERDIEAPTAELDAMCRELVARAVDDERMLKLLRIPERFWTFIAASWKRGDPSLYGRFDLSYDGQGPAKLLEYNADTPTSVFETARVPVAMAGGRQGARDHARRTPINTTRCTSG